MREVCESNYVAREEREKQECQLGECTRGAPCVWECEMPARERRWVVVMGGEDEW